jgi:hypothetical protein
MKGAGGIEFWIVSTWRIEQRATRKAIQQTPIVDLSLCAVRYALCAMASRNAKPVVTRTSQHATRNRNRGQAADYQDQQL